MFYRDEQEFMRQTFDKAINRIIAETFPEGITTVTIKNPFTSATSVNWTNFLTHSYTAVVRLEGSATLKTANGLEYSYNTIEPVKDSIMLVNEHTAKLLAQLQDDSTNKTLTDVSSLYKLYYDFVRSYLPSSDD